MSLIWTAKDSADLKEFVSLWKEIKPHLEAVTLRVQLAAKEAEIAQIRRA